MKIKSDMKENIQPEGKGQKLVKEDRRLRNLKYQMRKKGYVINDKDRVCVLADENSRSSLQEKRIKTFSFRLQYKML